MSLSGYRWVKRFVLALLLAQRVEGKDAYFREGEKLRFDFIQWLTVVLASLLVMSVIGKLTSGGLTKDFFWVLAFVAVLFVPFARVLGLL